MMENTNATGILLENTITSLTYSPTFPTLSNSVQFTQTNAEDCVKTQTLGILNQDISCVL